MDTTTSFEAFAKVELFGHAVLIARVTEAPIGGFVRCDVIDGSGEVLFTRLVNPKAIYSLSLVSRDAALLLAKAIQAEPPVTEWQLRQVRQLGAGAPADASSQTEDDDEVPV